METILGTIGVALNWLLACIGMPHQIYKIYRDKSAGNLSLVNFFLLFAVFLVSLLYGLSIGNQPLIFGNIPATIFSGIILGQLLLTNRK